MRVTVDTNVIISALYNPFGASGFILDRFANNNIAFALSIPTYLEYQDVLMRDNILAKIDLTQREVQQVLRFISDQSDLFDISFLWRPNLRDEADNMFVELAICVSLEK